MDEVVQRLNALAYSLGIESRTNYSGRGMYGAECFAIVGNTQDLMEFTRALTQDEFEFMGEPSTDNMGMDFVYYWRRLQTKGAQF